MTEIPLPLGNPGWEFQDQSGRWPWLSTGDLDQILIETDVDKHLDSALCSEGQNCINQGQRPDSD